MLQAMTNQLKPTILHGEDLVGSRTRLTALINEYKAKGWEILSLDTPSKEEFLNCLRSQQLFSSEQVMVAENFLITAKDALDALEEGKKFFSQMGIILWERKALSPGIVKKLSGTFTIQEFKLPSVLFALMDALAPGNSKQLFTLWQRAESLEPDLLFVMLARQVRLLLWAYKDAESMSVPSWQKGKLVGQAKRFSERELLFLHTRLLKMERDYKTSQLPESLGSSLELLFASL